MDEPLQRAGERVRRDVLGDAYVDRAMAAADDGAAVGDARVSWREAHRALERIAAKRAALDVDEARWLLVARRMEVHARLGYASFLEYVERVLPLTPVAEDGDRVLYVRATP